MNKLSMAQKSREGAQWVREHGFIRYTRWAGPGSDKHCALGVVDRVYGLYSDLGAGWPLGWPFTNGSEETEALVAALAKALHHAPLEYRNAAHAVADWNNRLETTAQDLIDLFEATALNLEIEALAEQPAEVPVPVA